MRDLGLCLGVLGRRIFVEGNVNGRNRLRLCVWRQVVGFNADVF